MDGKALEIAGLAAGWALYCALHSLLIHPPVARRFRRLLGRREGAYRFLFNAFSLISLIPLALWHIRLRGPWIIRWEGLWLAVPAALNLSALALFALGAVAYGPGDFFGLASARAALRGEPAPASGPFSSRGILRWVRHPWYAGSLLALWGHNLDAAGLAASTVLTAYLFAGAWIEERKLVSQFGDDYRRYQREVPMFIPRKPRGGDGRKGGRGGRPTA